MKPIVIKDSNRDRIEQAIKQAQAQARAKVRTITDKDVFRAVSDIEKKLQDVAKVAWEGVRVVVDVHGGERYPSVYKGTPESTQFEIAYTSGTWKLIDAYRMDVVQTKGGYMTIYLPEALQKAIIESFKKW